jgi:hypothetical protein
MKSFTYLGGVAIGATAIGCADGTNRNQSNTGTPHTVNRPAEDANSPGNNSGTGLPKQALRGQILRKQTNHEEGQGGDPAAMNIP